MKDVSRRANPGTWAVNGSLLGLCLGLLCCVYVLDSSMPPPGIRAEVLLLGLLVVPPFLGGAGGFVLALANSRRAPREQATRLPAAVETAARERFNAPRLEGTNQGEGGPDGRATPSREGLTGAD
jgi:hypothetical protein